MTQLIAVILIPIAVTLTALFITLYSIFKPTQVPIISKANAMSSLKQTHLNSVQWLQNQKQKSISSSSSGRDNGYMNKVSLY